MVEFFRKYLQQDSIGTIAYAHLAKADSKGIFDHAAISLAKKNAIAVDFSKTGISADALTDEEKSLAKPDYLQKYREPMYRSQRLVGKLYR